MTTLQPTIKPERPFLDWPVATDPSGWNAKVALLGIRHSEPYKHDTFPNDQANAPDAIRARSPSFCYNPAHWDFDVGTAGWIADYNDPSNFLDVLRAGGGNNYGRYSNPKFDALLDQAAAERDLAKRGQMLAQAEQMMLDDYPLVFVRFQTQPAIVQSYVKGWVPSSKQINRTRWLTVQK